jgi:hypothetical protein
MTDTERWDKIREISITCKCPIITASEISKGNERFYTKRIHMGSSDGVEDFIIIDYVDRLNRLNKQKKFLTLRTECDRV